MNIISRKKGVVAAILAVVMLLAGCGSSGSGSKLSYEDAVRQVNAYVENGDADYKPSSPHRDNSWTYEDTSSAELPTIDVQYPLSVKGRGSIDIEIFSSTEKANAKGEYWLDLMAKQFNSSGVTVNGKTVSVSIRPIASGSAMDYIKSGVYVPGAYSPSNELWGAMIESLGVKTQTIEKKLTGNVAGILIEKATYDTFVKAHGAVTVKNVVEAAQNCNANDECELTLGHTDPNVSSTGLNILTQELLSFDANDPLGQTAVDGFRNFQAHVPAAAPTTAEMAKVAAKHLLNAVIMESQAFTHDGQVDPNQWVFTPAGVRHDSPLYALGNLSNDQIEVLRKFAALCLTADNQRLATQQGFNQYDSYQGVANKYSGAQLFSALDLWKQNKDGGQPVISVFVVDRSQSMEGTKLVQAQQAMLNAAKYISSSNYVGMISYSSEDAITLDVPIAPFDGKQRDLFTGAVKFLRPAGNTATYSALIAGLKVMLDQEASIPNAKLRLIVMTDGERNRGLEDSQLASVLDGLGVPLYCVAFETNKDTLEKLRTLTDINEGYVIDATMDNVGERLKQLLRREL